MNYKFIQRCCVVGLLYLMSMAANAVTFDSSPISGCSYSQTTYTCAPSAFAAAGDVVVSDGITLTITGNGNISAGTFVLGTTSGFNGNVTASGTLAFAAGAYAVGTISAGGTVSLAGYSYVKGSLSAGTTARLYGYAYIIGDLTAGTTVALDAYSYVTGNLTAGSTAALAASVYIGGNVSAKTTLALAASVSVTGDVSAGSTLSAADGVTLSGNVSAGSTLTFATNVSVKGNVSAGTTLAFAGNVSVGGNVSAGTTATLASGVVIHGSFAAGSYTATAGVTFSGCQTVAGSTQCPEVTGPDHILITHSGSSLTCSPQTVTISACLNTACTSLYTAGLAVTLTPGGQSFTIDATGVNSLATVQQTTAGTVNLSATSSASLSSICYNTSTQTSSCAMTVAAAGFLFNVPNHVAGNVQQLNVSAVKMADNSVSCAPAFSNAVKTLNFQCGYVNPASGTLPLIIGGNVPLGSSLTSACNTSGANYALNFNSYGLASVLLRYPDVGQMTLSAQFVPVTSAEAGLVMTGRSNFIAAPATFGFSHIIQSGASALANVGPSDASGASFITAGSAFSATITALNASKVVAPNFGNESIPETVSLANATLIAPVGGANPVMSLRVPIAGATAPTYDAPGPFTNGVATATTLAWGEVGIISLIAKLANTNGYLGTSSLPNTLIATGNSPNIGRFIPAYFNTAIKNDVPMVCLSNLLCPAPLSSFVYSLQPFNATVTAFNLAGGIATNYSTLSGFAKPILLSAWSDNTTSATKNPPILPAASSLSSAVFNYATVNSFVQGVGSATAITYALPSVYPTLVTPTAPTSIYLRAVDTDGVSSMAGTPIVQGGVTVVGGRVQIGNNYGSELLPISVVLTAQYWDGSVYRNSATDSKSAFLPTSVTLNNCRKNKIAIACSGFTSVIGLPSVVLLQNGSGRFRLNAVGLGGSGIVDVNLSPGAGAPVYLPATTGRITYGLYKSPIVFIREMY